MVLTGYDNPGSSHGNAPAAAAAVGGMDAARLLAEGSLGTRLVRLARLAAAVHMAESAGKRRDGAQDVPGGAG